MSALGHVLVEHKSATEDITPGALYFRKLNLDRQVSKYFVGGEALGYSITECMYDVVRKLALEPKKATPEEERRYTLPKSKACAECKKKKPTPAPHVDAKTGLSCEDMWKCGEGPQDWTRNPNVSDDPPERRIVTYEGNELHANQRAEDETPDEFRARCLEAIAKDPNRYYARAIVVRSKEDLEDAAFDTWQAAKQIRESQKLSRWPRNPDSCMKWGRLCDFHGVCSRAESLDDPTKFQPREKAHAELPDDIGAKRSLPVLSTSGISTYQTCPRLYWYRYERLVEPVLKPYALRWGTLWHLGLEAWWKTGDVWKAIEVVRAAADEQELDVEALIKVECLLLGYHVRWRHEALRTLAVEPPFSADLINPETGAASRTWQLAGKLDAIAERITT